jgi:Transcriptional regulators
VHESTLRRVQDALKKSGYQLDPVVSAGMSRIRQRRFYRETLAWCGDYPPETIPWLEPFFRSMESYCARLGYAVEYFHFAKATPRELARLASIWRARGIRGVLLGPFRTGHTELPFPWDDLAWVVIGQALKSPVLHSVVRDYATDIRAALEWLRARGCKRPGFVHEADVRHLFSTAMMQEAGAYYRGKTPRDFEPYLECDRAKPEMLIKWLAANRPDGLVIGRPFRNLRPALEKAGLDMPVVSLSPPEIEGCREEVYFVARYDVLGQSAVSLLHRLLMNREFGLPAYKQTVALSSVFHRPAEP